MSSWANTRIRLRRILRPGLSPVERGISQAALHRRRYHVRLLLGSTILGLLIWAVLAIRTPTNPSLRPDQPSPVSIQAKRSLTYISQWRTEQERARAESAPQTVVYTRDLAALTQQRKLLADLLQTITQIRADPTLPVLEERTKLAALPTSTMVISPELALQLSSLADTRWREVQQLSLDLYDRAVGEYQFALDDQAVTQLRSFSLPYWASLAAVDSPESQLILLFVGSHLRSNLVIDQVATAQRKQQARAAIRPISVTILEGESVVRAGDMVTPDIQEKLEALGEMNFATNWVAVGGTGVIAALLATLFGGYLARLQRETLQRSRSMLTIVGLCGAVLLFARLVIALDPGLIYAVPLAMIVLLLAALYNSGLGLFIAALMVVPMAVLANGQLSVAAALLLGTSAGVFVIGRGERSLKFVLAGLATGLGTAVAAVGFLLAGGRSSVEELLPPVLLGMLNGAISAVLALGLYNVAGQITGVVTPLQLMELAHPAQPLLRKLIREAPGTYYHSIAVGNLAESAAEAIGADALLLRVASYYHDIGKTIRPYFFTDNQNDRENVHNDLDPQTSARIIADHVREGVVLAREAHLPRPIIDFISTHHGTSVIKHFYQLAIQQQDHVDIADYRYPGPRPTTREQGIMMLADTVEATVRSKVQHGKVVSTRDAKARPGSGQTIEELVTSILDERMHSGQLDECPLTLHDLVRIKQAFVTTLQGIYHPRVEYTPQVVKVE